MARHRSPGGDAPSPVLEMALNGAVSRVRGAHRLTPPSSAVRGRMVVAAVAVGAFAAATTGQALQQATTSDEVTPLAHSGNGSDNATTGGAHGVGGSTPVAAPAILPAEASSDADSEVRDLTQNQKVTEARLKREEAAAKRAEQERKEEEARGKVVKPAEGTLTSGYGARWGTNHNGLDIANSIGTPIRSVANGTVLEAGPATGFGLWVRVQHEDGTVTVYGHINSFSVSVGQKVRAGEQIAEMGNRGYSTGPHLHFEVWQGENGAKIDPRGWLAQHGVTI